MRRRLRRSSTISQANLPRLSPASTILRTSQKRQRAGSNVRGESKGSLTPLEETFMNKSLFVVMLLALSTCEPDSPTYAQSCNPAVVNYTVSEESGQVLSAPELTVVHERLPLPTSSVLAQEYIIRRLRFLRGRISTTARGRVVGART